jgi:hypothetical protein
MFIASTTLPLLTVATLGLVLTQDPGRTLTLLNDPVRPYVKLSAVIESGRLVLELQNGYHKTVTVEDLTLVSAGRKLELLEEPAELAPADRHFVELGHRELKLLKRQQGTPAQLRLKVNPQLERQPLLFDFWVSFNKGAPRDVSLREAHAA